MNETKVMMKNLLSILFASFIIGMVTVSFISCSKDHEDSTEPVEKVIVLYLFELEESFKAALAEAFDVYVRYYDLGKEKGIDPFESGATEWSLSQELTTFPNIYGIRIEIYPKEDLSKVPQGKKYSFEATLTVDGKGVDDKGRKVTDGSFRKILTLKDKDPYKMRGDGEYNTFSYTYRVDSQGKITLSNEKWPK